MAAARGTRRPHVRRPRSKPVRIKSRSGKKGCAIVVLALAGGLTTFAWTLAELVA